MTGRPPSTRDSGSSAWSVVIVLLLAPFAAAFAVSFAVAVVVILSSPAGNIGELSVRCQAWIAAHADSLPGMLVLFLPGQATFLAVALAFAAESGEGPLRRLGFTRSRTPPATIALAVVGTLGVQWAISMAFEAARVEPSPHLKEMWRMMSAPSGGAAVLLGVLLSVVPGICEEALFRGVGQRRLLERWRPFAAIGVASALFAIGHMDVQHALAVFPLGVWFGFVAWRTGSVRTSAACHIANNLSAFVCGRIWGDPESGNLPDTWPFVAAGIAMCVAALLAARSLGALAAPAALARTERLN